MRKGDSAFLRIMPAMSQVIDARNRPKLFLGGAIIGIAVLIFAVTLQSLLAEAQERRISAAANLAHVKRPG
jgi:hypothetical protein